MRDSFYFTNLEVIILKLFFLSESHIMPVKILVSGFIQLLQSRIILLLREIKSSDFTL